MSEHIGADRLHDYVDGVLPADARERVEEHLAECRRCAGSLEGLADTLAAVGSLPGEGEPARDLWPAILDRISGADAGGGGGAEDARVLAFPGADAGAGGGERRRWSRRGRVSFSLPQLAAAAAGLALLSGGSVWWAMSGGGGPVPVAEAPDPAAVEAPGYPVRPAATQLDAAVADLEEALEAGRHLLDPETVVVVEESLATVDRAIEEARSALARDPSSDLLNRLLINHQRTKLRVLQQATQGLVRS